MLGDADQLGQKLGKPTPPISQHLPASPSISQPHLPQFFQRQQVGRQHGFHSTTFQDLPGVQLEPKKDQEKPKNLKIIQRQEDLRWLARVLFPTKIHLQSSLIPFALSVCIQIIYFYYPDSTLKHNYTSLKPISTSKIKHCNLKSMEIHRKSL